MQRRFSCGSVFALASDSFNTRIRKRCIVMSYFKYTQKNSLNVKVLCLYLDVRFRTTFSLGSSVNITKSSPMMLNFLHCFLKFSTSFENDVQNGTLTGNENSFCKENIYSYDFNSIYIFLLDFDFFQSVPTLNFE